MAGAISSLSSFKIIGLIPSGSGALSGTRLESNLRIFFRSMLISDIFGWLNWNLLGIRTENYMHNLLLNGDSCENTTEIVYLTKQLVVIVLFGSNHPSSTKEKKNVVKVGPPLTKFSGSSHAGV